MSDPQLRRDINQLQIKLRDANAKIAELEASPPTVVETVVKEVPVERRVIVKDTARADELSIEVKRLRSLLASKPKVEVKTVEVHVPIESGEVIAGLRGEVKALKSRLKSKPIVEINNVEVAVPVEDGEVIAALKEEIKSLKSIIRDKPKTVIKEKQVEADVIYVDRVVTEYVKDPEQARLIKQLRYKLASA